MGLYMFLSDRKMEHGKRYINSLLHIGRLIMSLDLVWPYPETLLLSGPGGTKIGPLSADLVMYTPRWT